MSEKSDVPYKDDIKSSPALPLSTNTTTFTRETKRSRNIRVLAVLTFGSYAIYNFYLFGKSVGAYLDSPPSTSTTGAWESDDALVSGVDSYLAALEGKGWKLGLEGEKVDVTPFEREYPNFKHKKEHGHGHGHKHHGKHGHHHDHPHPHPHPGHGHGPGHGRRPFPKIGPKEAEEIFLKVPNNESIAA